MRVRLGTSAGASGPVPSPARAGGPPAGRTFTAVLGDRPLTTVLPTPAAPSRPAPKTAPPPPRSASGPVRAFVEGALGSERQVDALLAAAARGRTFSPSELLALQTTVFRYSQAVEVVSRAADKLVGAVKQTLGTQV